MYTITVCNNSHSPKHPNTYTHTYGKRPKAFHSSHPQKNFHPTLSKVSPSTISGSARGHKTNCQKSGKKKYPQAHRVVCIYDELAESS